MTGLVIIAALALLAGYGRLARKEEDRRFRRTLTRNGYQSRGRRDFTGHGNYITGRKPGTSRRDCTWRDRRRRFTAHCKQECWCCARPRVRGFQTHHLDYSRAGAGKERDRDLRLVCSRCHKWITQFDKGFQGLGFTLRGSSYAVRVYYWPARLRVHGIFRSDRGLKEEGA